MPILDLNDGGRLHYELIEGDWRKPALVFLHEGLGCTAMWKDFPVRLCQATGCPGLVYDRRGYGLSAPLAGGRSIHYLHEYALVELPQVLARLLPGRPHIVIGHSDGGSIALIYAAGKPAGLRGVLTEAAHVLVEAETLDGVRAARAAFEGGKLRGLAHYHGDKTVQIFEAWADTWLRPEFKHWNIGYLLAAIGCPVLALQGSEDQYATPAQLNAIAERAPQGRQLLVPHCGHSPHQEKPDLLLRLMAEYIGSLLPSTEET